jgi:hypothetical protein
MKKIKRREKFEGETGDIGENRKVKMRGKGNVE